MPVAQRHHAGAEGQAVELAVRHEQGAFFREAGHFGQLNAAVGQPQLAQLADARVDARHADQRAARLGHAAAQGDRRGRAQRAGHGVA